MQKLLRIGTRDSELAVWQAGFVKEQLKQYGFLSELIYIKSDGDNDLITPLYEFGVEGIFTRSLDAAILNNQIDLAVHSMKDVPTLLAKGITQAAVLPRASYKDILVFNGNGNTLEYINSVDEKLEKENQSIDSLSPLIIGTSSSRRKAQWLHRFPHHTIENIRGNVNTRLVKLENSHLDGAIFAAAGLERIGLRNEKSFDLDWMLPAPAQGAIMIVCSEKNEFIKKTCSLLDDAFTALCTKIERDFLRALFGGCATPIGALAVIKNDKVFFKGNILSPDGKEKMEIALNMPILHSAGLGMNAASELLTKGADKIVASIRNAEK